MAKKFSNPTFPKNVRALSGNPFDIRRTILRAKKAADARGLIAIGKRSISHPRNGCFVQVEFKTEAEAKLFQELIWRLGSRKHPEGAAGGDGRKKK